jgi:hypothetical protein
LYFGSSIPVITLPRRVSDERLIVCHLSQRTRVIRRFAWAIGRCGSSGAHQKLLLHLLLQLALLLLVEHCSLRVPAQDVVVGLANFHEQLIVGQVILNDVDLHQSLAACVSGCGQLLSQISSDVPRHPARTSSAFWPRMMHMLHRFDQALDFLQLRRLLMRSRGQHAGIIDQLARNVIQHVAYEMRVDVGAEKSMKKKMVMAMLIATPALMLMLWLCPLPSGRYASLLAPESCEQISSWCTAHCCAPLVDRVLLHNNDNYKCVRKSARWPAQRNLKEASWSIPDASLAIMLIANLQRATECSR